MHLEIIERGEERAMVQFPWLRLHRSHMPEARLDSSTPSRRPVMRPGRLWHHGPMLPRQLAAALAPIALGIRRPELARLERWRRCPGWNLGESAVIAVEAHAIILSSAAVVIRRMMAFVASISGCSTSSRRNNTADHGLSLI